MLAIWKYALRPDRFELEMPRGARILHVQAQARGAINPWLNAINPWLDQPEFGSLWALVETVEPKVRRTLVAVGTGLPVDGVVAHPYIGTVVLHNGALVLHVFDLGEQEPVPAGPLRELP